MYIYIYIYTHTVLLLLLVVVVVVVVVLPLHDVISYYIIILHSIVIIYQYRVLNDVSLSYDAFYYYSFGYPTSKAGAHVRPERDQILINSVFVHLSHV